MNGKKMLSAAQKTRLIRSGVHRPAWDNPAPNRRDPATVALSKRSEPYERDSFIASYCKTRNLDEGGWKARLNELLDEYAASKKSRQPEIIAEWLDAQRAIRAAANVRMRQPMRRRRYML